MIDLAQEFRRVLLENNRVKRFSFQHKVTRSQHFVCPTFVQAVGTQWFTAISWDLNYESVI